MDEGRERIIVGLEDAKEIVNAVANDNCMSRDNYRCLSSAETNINDAISFLKAQGPKLITPDEFFNHPDRSSQGCLPLWYEEKCGKQGWCFVYYLAKNPDERKRYWTSRPNTKQMEATPWET